MTAPSIARFQQLYLGGFAVGLVATAVSWAGNSARLAADPRTALVAGWFMWATLAISAAVTLALWFFIVRRASVVAKWIAVVLVALSAISAIGALMTLLRGHSPNATASILSLVVTVMQIAAVAMLFHLDAREWLGELPAAPQEPFA